MNRILLLFFVLLWTKGWGQFFYVTDNQGTFAQNNFVSIIDVDLNRVVGYVNSNGNDLTHPIDIHFNATNTYAYVVCDTVDAVYAISATTGIVVGQVNDTLNPFNTPEIIDIALPTNKAYVSNAVGGPNGTGSISVLDLSLNVVTRAVDDTLAPLNHPTGIAFSEDNSKAYATNYVGNNVTSINVASDAATGYVNDAVHPFVQPVFVAWSGSTKAFVSNTNNFLGGFISVIDAATDTVTGIVNVGAFPPFAVPEGIVRGPDGTIYVTDIGNNNVYVINPATNAVTAIFTGVFSAPLGIGILPDNSFAYVCNSGNNTVSIVNLATFTQTGIVDATAFPFAVPYQAQVAPALPTPGEKGALRPICIHGTQTNDRFASESKLYNTITWCPSPSPDAVEYNIYRNGTLIGTVSAASPLTFTDTRIKKNTVYTYGVSAVEDEGVEGAQAIVQVP